MKVILITTLSFAAINAFAVTTTVTVKKGAKLMQDLNGSPAISRVADEGEIGCTMLLDLTTSDDGLYSSVRKEAPGDDYGPVVYDELTLERNLGLRITESQKATGGFVILKGRDLDDSVSVEFDCGPRVYGSGRQVSEAEARALLARKLR